jgi:hypothetical protein
VSEYEDDPANDGSRADPEFSIAQSKAIIPMLVAAAVAVLVILLNITRTNVPPAPVGATADQAFGPRDFPAIFAETIPPVEATGGEVAPGLFAVPPPPFSEEIYPCSSCHDETLPPDPERRELEALHDDIVLQHDEEHRWCLDCHDADDRDHLRLASGALVPFDESYRLCGQCHGTQFRDWRTGIHGKRTGHWDGSKQYLLCVHCHDPHRPRFSPLEPLPPPVRPQFLRSAETVRPVGRDSAPLAWIDKETLDGRQAR